MRNAGYRQKHYKTEKKQKNTCKWSQFRWVREWSHFVFLLPFGNTMEKEALCLLFSQIIYESQSKQILSQQDFQSPSAILPWQRTCWKAKDSA
ncbi:MAG: hypothetical protein CSA20_06665 [Deltaproteobacteria bacterium]|nr:MAG: hypothetical protein CSA20_06665 [Deltaproteobacteria bacterium]